MLAVFHFEPRQWQCQSARGAGHGPWHRAELEGRSEPEERCSVRLTEPAADRRPAAVVPSPTATLSRPEPGSPLYTFRYNCVLSRNIIPNRFSHAPQASPSRCQCVLRSCVIRPHAHPWPRTRTPASQAAPHRVRSTFSAGAIPPAARGGGGCAHASGTPRAMRCEAALCSCMIASSRLNCAMPTPLSSTADLAVADSPLFARHHPAAVQQRGRSPVGGQVPKTPVRTFILKCKLSLDSSWTIVNVIWARNLEE